MKTIELNCPDEALSILTYCLSIYADAAYPPGASECAQVSHAALIDAASNIQRQKQEKKFPVIVSRRLRSNIIAALDYCQKQDKTNLVYVLLKNEVLGESVTAAEWLELNL